jgi:hypothetical protein
MVLHDRCERRGNGEEDAVSRSGRMEGPNRIDSLELVDLPVNRPDTKLRTAS